MERPGSVSDAENPMCSSSVFSLVCQALRACFRPYRAFFRWQTKFGPPSLAGWMCHVDVLLQLSVEKHSLYVEFLKLLVLCRHDGRQSPQGGVLANWSVIRRDISADHNLLGVHHQDTVGLAAKFTAYQDSLLADWVQFATQRLWGVHVCCSSEGPHHGDVWLETVETLHWGLGLYSCW
eukprot:1084250-Pelagomonas_calceolata.AAC.1